MTNISLSPSKIVLRRRLKALGIAALVAAGWEVAPAGLGKSSMRRVRKDGIEKLATIRTSQDTWIAFPRNAADTGWATLEEADIVVAASVDRPGDSRWLQAHVIDAGEMRNRFDRAYAARRSAGHQIDKGRGVWISLYDREANDPVTLVGAGAGLAFPHMLREPIIEIPSTSPVQENDAVIADTADTPQVEHAIPRAKAALAEALGISPSAIRISIEL